MKRLKERFVKVFKAEFLVGKDSQRNWITILLVLLLGIVMIYSGHLIDQKVYAIAALEAEVKDLRSEFVSVLSELQNTGLKQSQTPPNKIKVIVKEDE